MRKVRAAAFATAAAVVGVATAATPAHANTGPGSAETTGAYGSFSFRFASQTHMNSITLRSVDTLADGHHARIRLVTQRGDGSTAYWGWRANYGGAGSDLEWNTYLTDGSGIKAVRIQVCRAEGSTLLNCQYSSQWRANPYY